MVQWLMISDRDRLNLPPAPRGDHVHQADIAMARTVRGLCPTCGGPIDEDYRCPKCENDR